jgi:hypothetical protein
MRRRMLIALVGLLAVVVAGSAGAATQDGRAPGTSRFRGLKW